jgi:hypothetical protein
MEAGLGQRWELMAPGIPALRKTVAEDDERAYAQLSDVYANAIGLDHTVLHLAHHNLRDNLRGS